MLVRLSDIARRNDVATHSLATKTLPLLIDAGLICAVRGQGGGIRLARSADQIRLGSVIRATEISGAKEDCHTLDIEFLSKTSLVIDRVIDDAYEAFIAVLSCWTTNKAGGRRVRER